ncbi:hypothetical protein MPHO_13330 [Mycolicibacterium phocaicum]|nr:hypothetical protein MPHO_13330 [Mycolicibacterium phocaicum]
MYLRTARDTGDFRDALRRRAGVTVGDQAFHGGIQQARTHGRTSLGLRAPPGRPIHPSSHDCIVRGRKADSGPKPFRLERKSAVRGGRYNVAGRSTTTLLVRLGPSSSSAMTRPSGAVAA